MPALLEVEELTKSFNGITVIDSISFKVSQGEFVGLCGPNGAGKSTILDLITGYVKCDRGKVWFEGEEITGLSPYKIARKGIARTFQIPRPFLNLTLLENAMIAAMRQTRSRKEARELALKVLTQTGLLQYAYQRAKILSYGCRKCLEISRAVATNPKLLLLDEPFSGVNGRLKRKVVDLLMSLREREVTVLAIFHEAEDVKRLLNLDKLIGLHKGKKIFERETRTTH